MQVESESVTDKFILLIRLSWKVGWDSLLARHFLSEEQYLAQYCSLKYALSAQNETGNSHSAAVADLGHEYIQVMSTESNHISAA